MHDNQSHDKISFYGLFELTSITRTMQVDQQKENKWTSGVVYNLTNAIRCEMQSARMRSDLRQRGHAKKAMCGI